VARGAWTVHGEGTEGVRRAAAGADALLPGSEARPRPFLSGIFRVHRSDHSPGHVRSPNTGLACRRSQSRSRIFPADSVRQTRAKGSVEKARRSRSSDSESLAACRKPRPPTRRRLRQPCRGDGSGRPLQDHAHAQEREDRPRSRHVEPGAPFEPAHDVQVTRRESRSTGQPERRARVALRRPARDGLNRRPMAPGGSRSP